MYFSHKAPRRLRIDSAFTVDRANILFIGFPYDYAVCRDDDVINRFIIVFIGKQGQRDH